jgi:uroporphyrin-III C-methyltransferase
MPENERLHLDLEVADDLNATAYVAETKELLPTVAIDTSAIVAESANARFCTRAAVPDGWDWFGTSGGVVAFPDSAPHWQRIRSLFVNAVAFVGAGPGHQDYCTYMGIKALRHCDVCYYDALASPRLLDHLSTNAEAVYVGKRGGRYSVEREALDALLVESCRLGKRVVRLKGGDPGIFGRLTNEIEALESWRLPYRVVPGVSSLTMATTGTGMLLTNRGICRGFSVTTPRLATGDAGIPDSDEWRQSPAVFFMAVGKTGKIAADLVASGRPTEDPAAMIFAAGTDNEFIIHGTLADIGERVRNQSQGRPGLLVVGPTAGPEHGYRRDGAFEGRRILLLVAGKRSDEAALAVHDLGGVPVEPAGTDLPAFDLAIADSTAAEIFGDAIERKRLALTGAEEPIDQAARRAAGAMVQENFGS